MKKGIQTLLKYGIVQDSKRLRTFSKPQQNLIEPIDPKIFEEAALSKIIKLKDAFCKLKEQSTKNEIKNISLTDLFLLDVETYVGSFIIQASIPESTLFYTSPFSGAYKYFYDIQQERFISNKDQHMFDQNISREVMAKFQGILEI